MGSLARALRLSGPTLGRPPCSFLSSLRDVVPMVPNLISSPQVIGKRALILNQPNLPTLVKMSSAPSDLE
jgi:hypothetical protein